jgi:hypothetical protein
MKKIIYHAVLLLVLSMTFLKGSAQLSLNAQIRTRSEFRNGAGTLKPRTNDAAFFTSQRSRVNFNYKNNRVILNTSLQDVRVWGQDASTISNADGNKLGLHEAWAELILGNRKDSSFSQNLVDFLSLKIGRQELVYDDSRLLGNLDWLQQARRHDAVVLKLVNKGWQLDLGGAFNQHTDAFNYNGTYYTPANVMPYIKDSRGNLLATPSGLIPLANSTGLSAKTGTPAMQNVPSTNGLNQNYKSLQFLYVAKSFKSQRLTGLLVADQFGKYVVDSVRNISGTDTGYVFGRRFNQKGVHTRLTTGLLLTGILTPAKIFSYTAGAYLQSGRDRDGQSLSAYTTTASFTYLKNKFSYTAGWDYLSGNDAFSTSSVNHRFDPLYGTPHKFWGLMDYFYAGTGSPTGGLSNFYLKSKYISTNKRFTAALDYHYFALAQDQKDANGSRIDKYLGSEFDLVANYSLNKITSVEWGCSLMAASNSMEYAKGITPGTSRLTGTWSYVMLNIKPEFLFK